MFYVFAPLLPIDAVATVAALAELSSLYHVAAANAASECTTDKMTKQAPSSATICDRQTDFGGTASPLRWLL